MTKGKLLRYGKDYLRDLEHACCEIDEIHLNFVRESIKALEQEPVLDKIRAEIEAEIGIKQWEDYDYCSGLICARKIIDKYRESED